MSDTVIILLSIALLVLVLYLTNFKFEFRLKKEKNDNSPAKPDLDKLSNTEIKILKLVAEGKSNQEIAEELFISVHTVKKHVSNMFKKLNINSRAETRKYKELVD